MGGCDTYMGVCRVSKVSEQVDMFHFLFSFVYQMVDLSLFFLRTSRIAA